MIKKLTKHGNSYALIIDKPILELLHFTIKCDLEITTDGESLTIRRADSVRSKRINAALDKIDERYGDVLQKLAE